MGLKMLAGRRPPRPRPSWSPAAVAIADRVLAGVAARYGLDVVTARRSNTPTAVTARREWLRLVRDTWALSNVETGRLCGVDATSVLLACRVSA